MRLDKPISVLYLNHCANLSGGAERSLAELLKALPQKCVFAKAILPSEGSLSRELSSLHIPSQMVPFLPLRRSRNPIFLLQFLLNLRAVGITLRKAALRRQCEVIHANSTTAAVYAAFAFRNSDIPVIWHCRDLVELGWVGKWLGRHVSRAVAISRAVHVHLTNWVDSDRICLILNGVDPEPLKGGASRPQMRKIWEVDVHAPVIGMAAHLVPWKNHQLFLQACARISSRHKNARYVIAGGDVNGKVPGYLDELHEQVAILGLGDRVKLIGNCEDMAGFYRSIDILCHTTAFEPFGRSVAEAMTAGRPVLAIRGSAPGEYIKDGVSGMLAQTGDAEDIANQLSGMISRPDLARKMGKTAAAMAARDLSIDRVAGQVVDLYRELTEEE